MFWRKKNTLTKKCLFFHPESYSLIKYSDNLIDYALKYLHMKTKIKEGLINYRKLNQEQHSG